MRLPPVRSVAILLIVTGLHAADPDETRLKDIVKEARAGDQEALGPLRDFHSHKSGASAVLSLATDRRVGLGIKLRLAEIVSTWPPGEARKSLGDWLLKHPSCENNELLFFAEIGLPEARSVFWSILAGIKGPLAAIRDPERVALAARALGAFQDNPEPVVSRIASLLDPACQHVMRACGADALGGIRHPLALESLLPHLNDDAIGSIARRSLYRLTGTDFGLDTDKWTTWLKAQDSQIPWKMLTRTDFDNYLKLQKLLKPLDDDPAGNLASFYGIEFKAKAALFILDVSGSMNADGRITKLKAQMSNLLVAMGNHSDKLRYGIITFGEAIDSCFSRGMAVNDDKSRRQAERFLDRIEAEGGTPMCAALTHALTRILPEGNVDTIYFLSDGQPCDGTPAQVVELAQRIHETFQTRIHTVSIGEDPAPDADTPSLLQQIATACDGTFVIPP
ncbi:MAG: VWA domain-containing protein [Prosthecobacter sp.]|jgi:uncharacterized protein YegL|nr:VWA domain-containing protein [Prosthecobacter sp.]